MGSVINFAEYLKNVIQAGQAIEGNVVKIIADNGREVGDAVFKVIQGGNGVSNEVGVAVETSTATATTTGLAYMAVDVSVAGAAIAPALGVLAGVGLYSLAPEFWTNVSNALVEAGQTIGGKVIAYWNGDNVNFDMQTIEIYKNALLATGIFTPTVVDPSITNDGITSIGVRVDTFNPMGISSDAARIRNLGSKITSAVYDAGFKDVYSGRVLSSTEIAEGVNRAITNMLSAIVDKTDAVLSIMYAYANPASFGIPGLNTIGLGIFYVTASALISFMDYTTAHKKSLEVNDIVEGVVTLLRHDEIGRPDNPWGPLTPIITSNAADVRNNVTLSYPYNADNVVSSIVDFINPTPTLDDTAPVWFCFSDLGFGERIENPNTQPGAVLPNAQPFPGIYPGWLPWEYPITIPSTDLPTVYPVKYPGTDPDPYPTQDPAQNPAPEPYVIIIPIIAPNLPIPEPIIPTPDPMPEIDPDTGSPYPDPIEDPKPRDPDPDPIDPNPDPDPTPVIPEPSLPSTVSSNKLFTVYNPDAGELNDLGAYLWDSSIMASIRDIWQDPLDGIISLIQVYATPVISGTHNIILGFLDSGVSSNVVGSQFATVNCGSVSVPENKFNATDYAPYTSLHLYLPFIGIVELDTNECMKATINVKYKIDVYTGTCLATVSVTRTEDMPNAPILYTYSGNCSQQIPLTSGNATGMFSALIGGITAGLSVASGGGLGVLAGAQIAGQSLTHEMFHVSHSGNISANAGIMGNKKPYLIIGRRHCYDANNYNALYGFPANKTIVLGNHEGYTKVKKCFLKTTATQPEHNEIMRLLQEGVIL